MTVVTSVFDAVTAGVKPLLPVTVMVLVLPLTAVPGRVPTTMKRNCALAASGPVLVMGGPVGWPLPLSAKICTLVIVKPAVPLTPVRPKVSIPLPVLVSVCG